MMYRNILLLVPIFWVLFLNIELSSGGFGAIGKTKRGVFGRGRKISRLARETTSRTINRKATQSKRKAQMNDPETELQCNSDEFKDLRVCRLSAKMLASISGKYLCKSRRFKPEKPRKNQKTEQSFERNRRTKRSLTYNPCEGDVQTVALMLAQDLDGVDRELVADRSNYLYQTIVRQTCKTSFFQGYSCAEHNITLEAAVFSTDPTSNNISLAYITTPAYCAVTITN